MSAADSLFAQPDPRTEPEFYQSVPAKRAIAWVIDSILIGIMAVLILPFTAFTGLLFFPALMMFIGFFYRWFTISGSSATLGMRLMAIELRQGWGDRLDSRTAFLHTAAYTFAVIAAPLQLISAGFMAFSERGQGLGDIALQTVMINRPR